MIGKVGPLVELHGSIVLISLRLHKLNHIQLGAIRCGYTNEQQLKLFEIGTVWVLLAHEVS